MGAVAQRILQDMEHVCEQGPVCSSKRPHPLEHAVHASTHASLLQRLGTPHKTMRGALAIHLMLTREPAEVQLMHNVCATIMQTAFEIKCTAMCIGTMRLRT